MESFTLFHPLTLILMDLRFNCSIFRVTLSLLAVLFLQATFAQDTETILSEEQLEDYLSLSLEELMNIELTVASTEALSARESPGIVSLITSDEIASMGARDLIDVLRLIPGFEFGVDVQGVVGIGLRGNWGHEGKILILLDGQEMNERNYATTQLGNHFPIEHIDRIEIIRGPGSATYGGYAELGVVNIITKKGDKLIGGSVTGTYGQLSKTYGRREANVMVGTGNENYAVDAKLLIGDGNRSDRDYTDYYGDVYSMKDNSAMSNLMLNAGVNFKGADLRIIYEDYRVDQRDLFGESMPEPVEMHFENLYAQLKYDIKIGDKLTITPKFQYKDQQPWRANDDITINLDTLDDYYYGGVFSSKHIKQTLGELNLNGNISDKINLLGGVQYYKDKGESVTDYEYSFTGTTTIDFTNFSAYAQGLFKLDFAIITLGARYNSHEQFGSSFVPRIGITKVINKFHAKMLLSQAFRAPSIENIDLNFDIKPEQTTVFEIEAGYQLTSNMILTANFYNISINDPIVYFYDDVSGDEGYLNYDKTGTRGFEVEYRFKPKWGNIGFNYSSYSAGGNNKVDSYEVISNENRLVGLPENKFNLFGSIKLGSNLSLSPSFTFLDNRSGYDIDGVQENYDEVLFANLYFLYRNLFIKGLQVGAGVFNLTDSNYAYVQPYNSGHTPMPASGREIVIRLKYRFKF